MEPLEFQNVLLESIHKTMNDAKLKDRLSILEPLASHAHNSPREIEQGFLEKISINITKKMASYFAGNRTLFLLPLPDKNGATQHKAVLYWRKNPPVPVGALYSRILREGTQLFVEFTLDICSCEPLSTTVPLSHHIQGLRGERDRKLLPVLDEEKEQLVFIDLEWVSCYKGDSEKSWVDPGQISEFSFQTGDYFYKSGYLKVTANYLKRMHKKLLVKMGISPEIMQQRHKEGATFLEEWQGVMVPLMEQYPQKTFVFLSYGTEDGKILKKLFTPTQLKKTKFIDVSGHYAIFNFGQMPLLNGLGVTFTHDFSSDMDVKALCLIYQVFAQCKTVEDSRNLQLALQLHKMQLQSQQEEDEKKLALYLSFLLENKEINQLFQNAVSYAKELVEGGHFDWEHEETPVISP